MNTSCLCDEQGLKLVGNCHPGSGALAAEALGRVLTKKPKGGTARRLESGIPRWGEHPIAPARFPELNFIP